MILRRLTIIITFLTAWVWSNGQQINAVPDYVFRNQMSVGRNAVTDTAAYFSIGPRYGATKGFMPPIVGDTATFSSGKRNGLLIFSVQKNKFLYWDSVRVQWSDMAGSSGSYITGSGITGYLPQFSASTTIDTSALFTLGNRLGIGSSTFAYNSTNTANVELNGTAGGILGFKRNDSARGYLWHTGDNMELANTAAGSIFFNTNSATRGSISSAGVWRLHNLAGTGDRVVQASSNGTLSATTSVTGLVDTLTISTRAWRQKGLDSLAALEVSGSGTINRVAKFTASGTIGNGSIADSASTVSMTILGTNNIGIGTVTPQYRLHTFGATGIRAETSSGNISTGIDFASAFVGGRVGGYYAYPGGGAIGNNVFGESANGAIQNIVFSESVFPLKLGTIGAGPLQFYSNSTERLRITSGGDVGIGTSSPTGTANRSVNIYGAASNELHLTNATTGTTSTDGFTILQSGNDIYQYNYEAGFLEFGTSNASRLRIFANGRVGINTTTDAGYQLDINGTLRSVNGANFATTSGKVGIGTTSPGSEFIFDARGRGAFQGTTGYMLDLVSNDANATKLQFYLDANEVAFVSSGTAVKPIKFYLSGEKFRFNTDGELWVNTQTDAGDYKLQVSGNIYNTGSAVLAATSGNVGVGVTPSSWSGFSAVQIKGAGFIGDNTYVAYGAVTSNTYYDGSNWKYMSSIGGAARHDLDFGEHKFFYAAAGTAGNNITFTRGMTLTVNGELLVNTTTDNGDYKLQVSGNALVTAGKLDITTNTGFGLSVTRSGTSVVAGQINNSNGILYYGAESSTGGGLFTGSSAYAAVIGSGAAYPLQFATDNVTRATINTNGELLINTTTDNGDFKLQVNGNALISGSIKTANGTSSTAVPWHLGSVVATNVQLDTANYVEVEINGTFYRLAIVTPL